MEKLNFASKYSFKNIPTPGKLEYTKQLVYSLEQLLRRMRWRAFYFLELGENNVSSENEEIKDENIVNGKFSYLFRSGTKPPYIKEMCNFEKELLELPKNSSSETVQMHSKRK